MTAYKKQALILTTLGLLAILLTWGCGGGGNGPGYDARANLNRGWTYFGDGDYDSAVTKFVEVMTESPADSAEAFLGRGWSRVFTTSFTGAVADFGNCLRLGNDFDGDCYMGLAAVYRDLPDYQLAISNAGDVIAEDSNYVFSRKTTIDYKDAHLIKAQCYYRLGTAYFALAHIEVNYLCGKLGQALLPEPGTMSAAEYEQALADKIELLSGLVSD